jgi:hypothetical protein
MPSFIAHWDILHDGLAIPPGGVVELSQEAALPLLARGVIAPVTRIELDPVPAKEPEPGPTVEPAGTETPIKPPAASGPGKRRAAKDDG